MTREDIQAQVMAFMQARFPQHELQPTDDIFGLGFVNSLFAMELVVFVESTFGFTVPNEQLQLDTFRTAARVADLVEEHQVVATS